MAEDNVIVFDGVCNFCSWAVQFVIERDPEGLFRFAPAQSEAGRRLLEQYGVDPEELETFLLVRDGKAYTRSDGAIAVASKFRGLWRLLGLVRILPGPFRDRCYSLFARNRYRLFGRKESCMIPTPDVRARFLE